jgi:hypothetical protein
MQMHMHGAVSIGAAPALRDSFMIAHAFDAMTLLYMCSILQRANRSCAAIVHAYLFDFQLLLQAGQRGRTTASGNTRADWRVKLRKVLNLMTVAAAFLQLSASSRSALSTASVRHSVCAVPKTRTQPERLTMYSLDINKMISAFLILDSFLAWNVQVHCAGPCAIAMHV